MPAERIPEATGRARVISRSNVDASAYRPETRRSPPRLIVLLADFGLPVAAEVCDAAGKLRLDLSKSSPAGLRAPGR